MKIKIRIRSFLLFCMASCATQGLFAQDTVTSYQLPVTSDRLPVTGYRLPVSDTIPEMAVDTLRVSADSLQVDTVPARASSSAIDAPVEYTAKDSTVMLLRGGNRIFLYGEATVLYTNLDLAAANIVVDADSSIITATSDIDSLGQEFGYPSFKEGDTQYEFRKARYNFKTKKLSSTDIITNQGDGYVTAARAKKMSGDEMFMVDGRFTTCDEHDDPHYYFHMTKAMVEPGKRTVFGPTYLVMEGVPLPLAVPFGFFPFTKDYSSGVIMPTYADEMARGFGLRDGGYYFAISDYIDLAVTGEYFTRGSWGLNAVSNYRKRYKYSGNLQSSYLVTITGEKEDIDYSEATDFRLSWTHTQDPKANPFGTFSASVNYSTSSYNRNQLNGLANGDYTQNTKSSTVNYSYRPPNSVFSFSANASLNQVSRDTTLSVTFPNFSANMRDIYPFRRKEQIGESRWYENIRMSYSGSFTNSISNVKEYQFMEKNVLKDWNNSARHSIPISASFNAFKAITITPSINYNERWVFREITQGYNPEMRRVMAVDTATTFHRIYDYSASVSANTKIYGMFQFARFWGKWAEKTQIRHVMTPSISLSGSPDFSTDDYGHYRTFTYYNSNKNGAQGGLDTVRYSPYGFSGGGKSGTLSFALDNNVEIKTPIAGTDSTRKTSLIDNLNLGTSYNMLADSLNWSDLRASLRVKLFGSTISLQGSFEMYRYGENGQRINQLRLQTGGFPRLKSTGTSFSYTFNNATITQIRNFFQKEETTDETPAAPGDNPEAGDATDSESATPGQQSEKAESKSLRGKKKSDDTFDDDGYYVNGVPWSLSLNFSLNMSQDMQHFDKVTREYPYMYTKSLGVSGNISPTKNWSISMSTTYDFDQKKFATMNCNITRKMHCWNMTASFIPIGPYQYYSFTIAISSAILQDIKYTQSSNYRDAGAWGE